MKKLLLGMLLGFLLHKGLYAIYTYAWWTAEASVECRDVKLNKNLSDAIACVNKKIEPISTLSIVLAAPSYTFREWEWTY